MEIEETQEGSKVCSTNHSRLVKSKKLKNRILTLQGQELSLDFQNKENVG